MTCFGGDASDSEESTITPESHPNYFKPCKHCALPQYISDYGGNYKSHHVECPIRIEMAKNQISMAEFLELRGNDVISCRPIMPIN